MREEPTRPAGQPPAAPARAVLPLRQGDPERLGPYELLGRLGEGGMGTVYLGRRPGGPLVAVKVVRAELGRHEEFRRRFRQEVATARRVARFCTAPVLDADLDAERPYVVTEYVAGPTLREVVAVGGPLPSSSLEGLAVGMAAALTAIHGAGVVHRDLKPGNVLLSQVGPRVIDFGIARALDATTALTGAGQRLGTPAFMAPEQFDDERPVTAAADVFAWGSVVAYAGTGRLPFGSGPAPALAYRVVHGAADLDGLEPSLGELVQASMAKDPAARPGAHHLLLRLLGNVTDPQAAVTEVLQRTWAETEQLTSVPRPPADPVDLALALEERGDTAAAQAAYRQACEAGAPGQAAKAARNLGLLLKREGDVAGAREAFWRAVHAGDPDQSPKAARNLGYLLAEEGDVDGARAAYEWVMGSAHPEEAPAAARNLGVLAEQQGDPQAAAALYRWAIASGHPEEAPAAAVNLVALLVEQGDAEGARAAARAADDHPAYAFMVASNLRLLDRPGR